MLYGIERAVKVLLDLIVVKFLTSYLTKPIYVFGGFGLLNIGLSMLALAAAVTFKLIPPDNPWGPTWHKDLVETPLPVVSIGLLHDRRADLAARAGTAVVAGVLVV